jgi:hypothetical protein
MQHQEMNMYNKNYLSKRPFLVVSTKFLPGPGARTAQKNWAEQSGWNVVEEVAIVDRVTPKHQTFSTLIVDILESKCVKNGFAGSTNDEAMAHFMQKYKEQIKEAVGIWLEREAQKMAATKTIQITDARKTVQAELNAVITGGAAATEAVVAAPEADSSAE